MESCAVFLDAGYIENVINKEYPGTKVDFYKLAREMAEPDNFLRCYYYNCLPYMSESPTDEERDSYNRKRRFVDALTYLPRFEVRLGRLHRGYDSMDRPFHYQKMVDIMLCTDMLGLSIKGRVSSVAVFTGDSDCVPAIEAVKREGVTVRLWHGNKEKGASSPPSSELYRLCDERYDVASIMNLIQRPEAVLVS